MTGHALRHNPVGAVDQLLYAPELGVLACIGGNSDKFFVCSSSKGPVGSFNLNLVIWSSQVSACVWNGGDGPPLVRTEHIVVSPYANLSLRPFGDNVNEFLVLNGERRIVYAAESPGSSACHADEVNRNLKGVSPAH